MRHSAPNPAQLGFDSLLAAADEENERRLFFRTVTHLPSTWDDALPYFQNLLDLHHAAMLKADEDEVIRLRGEAHDLATKLNGGTTMGICASDGIGKRLEAETAATGEVPKWGQAGSFVIDHNGMAVRVEMEGMFGIGSSFDVWPSFQVHAVHRRKPFISETGFRSFIGCGYPDLIGDMTPDQFVVNVLTDHLDNVLHGKLVRITPEKGR